MKRLLTGTASAAMLVLGVASPALASTSTPPEETAQAPAAGSTYHSTWTGTVPVGAQPQDQATDACITDGQLEDTHVVHYTAPANPAHVSVSLTFTIAWVPVTPDGGGNGVTSQAPASDMEIAVRDSAGNIVAEDDGNQNQEQVVVNDLPSGDYTVDACGFLNAAPQPYTGTLDIATVTKNAPPPPVFEDSTGGPGADLPEAPYAVLMPVLAAVVGGVLLWRRRRS